MPAIKEHFVSNPASTPEGTRHWPTDVRLKRAERCLEMTFDDGAHFVLPAELLRVESPSAEVQGHGDRAGKRLVTGARNVAIVALEPVGNYALRLIFDDGHDTGIYSWTYLYGLGHDREALWSAYLAELAARGLSRGSC